MILITGPTGSTGTELVRLFEDSQHDFRCMVRRQDAFDQLKSQGLDVVMGDFDSKSSLLSALEGVDCAYLVCTPDEHLADRELRFIEAAVEKGVARVVKLSAFWAAVDSPSPNLVAHGRIEKALQASGMDVTVIRPHGFFQTVYWMNAPSIQAQGVMAAPAGEGKAPYLDIRDVAMAAFTCLTEPGHGGKTYEITGSESLSMHEIGQRLAEGLGRAVNYMDMPPEQMEAMMRSMGVAETSIIHVSTVFKKIRLGESDFTTDTLKHLGISARTWKDFVRDLSSGMTGAATSFTPPAPKQPSS